MAKNIEVTEKAEITPLFESPTFSGAKSGIMAGGLSLSPEDGKKLKELLDSETATAAALARACLGIDDAKDAVRQSQKKRDDFCLEIEKKYGIAGKKWTVDFSTGEIKVN